MRESLSLSAEARRKADASFDKKLKELHVRPEALVIGTSVLCGGLDLLGLCGTLSIASRVRSASVVLVDAAPVVPCVPLLPHLPVVCSRTSCTQRWTRL